MAKTIAVAMIVKNEEALLARCLETVKEADAIYILDTGSTDRTVEIARKYTDNVFLDYVWVDDFSSAQNHIKSKVKEDWILSIDADERLIVPFSNVREAAEKAKDVVRVHMVAEGQKTDFGFSRLFRNTPDIYWVSAIHKHLNIPGEGEEVGNVSIQFGYSPAHLLDPDRSLRMLEATVEKEENPVRNLYYLGREYWYKERYQDCVDTLERYSKVAHWMAELADAYLIMAQASAAMNKAEECATYCAKAIITNSNFKEAIEYMASISIPENKMQWERMARAANNEGVLWKRTEAEPVNDVIFLSTHNDDESLFGAYTCMRVKPLVVLITDSFIQPERGDVGCDAHTRRQETIEAMKIAGCPVLFLGIKDTELTEELLRERLKGFNPARVYAPAIHEGGNVHHNIVGKVALEMFGDRCERYTTYNSTELYIEGNFEVKPTLEEMDMKIKMLDCYKSQLALDSTRPHFWAVRPNSHNLKVVNGKSEWLM